MCTVLYDYEAQGDDELSLCRGDIIEVLSQDVKISGDEGWWTGKINGKVSRQTFLWECEICFLHCVSEVYFLFIYLFFLANIFYIEDSGGR